MESSWDLAWEAGWCEGEMMRLTDFIQIEQKILENVLKKITLMIWK